MPPTPARRLAAGASLALLLALGACGGGGDDEAADTETEGTTDAGASDDSSVVTEPASSVVNAALECSASALTAALNVAHPDTTASYQRCSSAGAVAWVTGGDVNEQVAFFKGENGAWVLISVNPLTAELDDNLPTEIGARLFDRFLAEKQASDVAATATTAEDSDTAETVPEETTTTLAPSTTATPQIDPYCLEYPNEPSCLENPYL